MTKTVFVVGAGAGYDFDMPLGNDLVRDIAELLKGVEPSGMPWKEGPFWDCIRSWLSRQGRPFDRNVVDAVMRLSRSIHFAKSIDTLINDARDPLVKDIGKIAISHLLSQAEHKVPFLFSTGYTLITFSESLDNRPPPQPKTAMDTFEVETFRRHVKNEKPIKKSFSQSWFTSFFRELRAGLSVEEFKARLAATTIISFNYDRLLEHFLTIAISQYDGVSLEVAQSWLSKMNIIHPYGILAEPPTYRDNQQVAGIPVGMLETRDIANAPDQIRTFDEGVNSDERAAISDAMANAESVVLLGYGFHRQNNDLLGLHQNMEDIRVWGTAMGLSDAKRAFISREIHDEHQQPKGEGSVRLEPLDCRDLIDEFGDDFFPLVY